jgi:arylsulfatase A-like enzyme
MSWMKNWPGAVALGLCCCWFASSSLPAAERPNIILCMTDDQGWGDVSYNGLAEAKTPNLDDMAASGLMFTRFYAAAPVCSPTRASVLTGRHPNRGGTFLYGYPLRHEETCLAAVLKSAGYATGHFGKWHLNGVSGPGKPISGDDPLNPGTFGFDQWVSVSNFYDLDPLMSRNGVSEQFQGDGSDIAVAEALKFIRSSAEQKQPFFAVIWFGSPHNPHRALAADVKAAGGSQYYGEIIGVDRAMGHLRTELREQQLADNTIVWFCSDNGGTKAGSVGGLRGNKGSVWEGGVRVPCIIEWPAKLKPRTTDVVGVTSDIYPTLVELLGLKVEQQVQPLDGISLVPLLEGKLPQRPRPIGFWHHPKAVKSDGLKREDGQVAWTDNRYKLVKIGPQQPYELYDLIADRNETHDLAAEHPEVVAKMKAELDAWQASVIKSYAGEDYERSAK